MQHTPSHTHSLNTSTRNLINGWHLLLVVAFVFLLSVGFAALFYGHTAAATAPSLGTAQGFAVLGGSTVTNTGMTTVSGELGVNPGTAITGFPPGLVIGGTIHTNDAVALQAQNDVTAAYNALAAQACNTVLTGTDLGGLTLTPGVYCFASSAQLTGTLTLDAQGDSTAVFVFQIGTTLTTASTSSVQIINGGQNCNVFWQVGSSATLGTGTSFIGSILALASITLNTNATLSGRALARTGAVTMDSNAITRTTCAPTLDVSFTPATIPVDGVSTKSITLSNPNTIVANITALTDTLPAGLVIATPPNATNTCGGMLTATAGGGTITLTGGAIPAGNGIIAGTCTITVGVTAALPGSYTNTLPAGALQTSNGNNSAPVGATLTVACPPTNANAGMDQLLCQTLPGPTVFTVTGALTNGTPATPAWTVVGTTGTAVPTILTPNTTTTGVNVAGTGTVTLRFTVNSSASACGTATDDVVLTVTTNATAAAGADQTLCQTLPGPTVFTVSTTSDGALQWTVFATTGTAVATIVSPNSATTAVNVTGIGTVTLRLTSTTTCGTAIDDVVLTVTTNATAAAGLDQTLCQTLPGPTVFTVSTTSGGALQWTVFATTGTAVATIVSPNSATTAVNVTGIGTVTLRLTSTTTCGTAIDDVVLTVTTNATAAAGLDQTLCQTLPGPTVFTVSTTSGGALQWTVFASTGTAAATIISPNSATTAVNVTGIGTVTLRLTSTTTCGTATDDVVLTVTTNATAAAGADQTLCQTLPGPTVFTVSTMSGGALQWTVFATTGTAAATIISPNSATTAVNVTGIGTVTLRLTSTTTCGTAIDDVVLTVTTNATAAAGLDQTLCQTLPGPTVFTVSTTSGGALQWTVFATTGTAVATIVSPNSATTAVNVTGIGTVTLRLTSTTTCGTAIDDVVLTVTTNATAAAGLDQTLCQTLPGPTVFTVSTTSGGALQWTVFATTGTAVATIVSPNSATTAVNVTGIGTVTLRLTSTTTCGTAIDDVVLTVTTNATAAAGLDQTLCQTLPGPTVFTVSTTSGGALQWTVFATTGTAVATIVSPNSATTAVNVTGIGTVTLRLTSTTTCGTAIDDVVLTVTTNATAAAGLDQTLCQTLPGPTVFTVSTMSGGALQWTVFATTGTAVATIVSPNSATTAVNVTGIGTVTLRLTSTTTCGTATDDVVLTVTTNATAAAGADQTLCQTLPGPTVFTVSTTSGGALQWTVFATTGTAVATIVSPNSATTAVNVTGIGTVTLRLTSTTTCGTAIDDVVLTVTTNATAAAGLDQTLCQTLPGPTVFTVSTTSGALQWTVFATTGTAVATIVSPNSATTAVNVTGIGTVTLRLTSTTTCGTAIDDVVLTVTTNATAAAGLDQTLCQTLPGPTVFTVSTTSGGALQWTVFATTGTAVATIVSPNSATTAVNVTGIGTVTLRLTSTTTCGTAIDDVVLTVTTNATAAAGADQTLCQTLPGPTVFTVSTTSGGTLQWTVFATTGTAVATIVSPNSATTAVNVTGIGTVTLRLTSTTTCGTAIDDVVLTVTTNATAAAGADQTLCQTLPGPTVFTVSTTSGGALQWTVFASTGTAVATIVSPNSATTAVNVTGIGTVTLRLTSTTTCGTAIDDVVLTVTTNATAAAGADQTLCQTLPGPTVFTVSTTSGGTLQWTVFATTGTAVATIVSPNSATTAVNVTGIGTVTLRLTSTTTCGTAIDDVVLTVTTNATAAAGLDQTLCQTLPGPTVFTVSTTSGGTLQWTVFASTGTAAATIISPNSATTAVNVTGIGTVTLRLTSTTTCGTAIDDVVLTVTTNATAAAGADQTLCQTLPGPTVFTVSTTSGGTLQWTVFASTGTAAATIISPNSATTAVNVTGIGTVTLRLTSTTTCGTAIDDVVLTVTTNATAAAGADQTLCQTLPGPTVFTVSTTSGGALQWTVFASTGTAAATIISPNSATTAVNVTGIGTVTLRLTSTTTCGTATDDVVLTVDPCTVDVCIEKTGSALVAIEAGQFTYTLSAINLGPGAATGVTVTDTLPAGVTLVSVTPSQGTCSGTSTITCNLGNLAAQATATISLVVTLPMNSAGSMLCNTATITSNQTEIAPANNTSTLCVPVEKDTPASLPSDQKPGSILVYPYYTSNTQLKTDTRVSISNVGKTWVAVHLFFIERGCTQADMFLCLSPNASYAEKASVLDPEFTGYIIAVAVDNWGLPISANQLIGNALVNDGDYVGNYGAEAFANLAAAGTRTTTATATSTSATLVFNGELPTGYNQIPNQFAVEIQSPNDAVGQRIIAASLSGDISSGSLSGANQVGIGQLYRGDEQFRSFSGFFSGTCQRVGTINATTPRVPSGLGVFLGKGDIGVMRWDVTAAVGLFLTPKTSPNVWSGIRGLHKTRLAPRTTLTMPVFEPGC